MKMQIMHCNDEQNSMHALHNYDMRHWSVSLGLIHATNHSILSPQRTARRTHTQLDDVKTAEKFAGFLV